MYICTKNSKQTIKQLFKINTIITYQYMLKKISICTKSFSLLQNESIQLNLIQPIGVYTFDKKKKNTAPI